MRLGAIWWNAIWRLNTKIKLKYALPPSFSLSSPTYSPGNTHTIWKKPGKKVVY